jgi:hypothetical protein
MLSDAFTGNDLRQREPWSFSVPFCTRPGTAVISGGISSGNLNARRCRALVLSTSGCAFRPTRRVINVRNEFSAFLISDTNDL